MLTWHMPKPRADAALLHTPGAHMHLIKLHKKF